GVRRPAEGVVHMPVEDVLRWGWLASGASVAMWDPEGIRATNERQLHLIRDAGALAELPPPPQSLATEKAGTGGSADAAPLIAESHTGARAPGSQTPPFAELTLLPL